MCGINGVLSINNIDNKTKKKFNSSLNCLKHRGPDQIGFFKKNNVLIGNTRLKINDLKDIETPLIYKNRYVISFNGELINFRELKKKFFQNENFATRTDTEVVVAMYHKFKENCLKYFNGMFSISIYDKKKNEIFLARDKFGIKPLYYNFNKKMFHFSSELKSIRKFDKNLVPNAKIFDEFLVFGSIAGKETFYEKVYKVNPSCYLSVKIRKKKFLVIEKNYQTKKIIQNYSKKNLEYNFTKILKDVVQDWRNSDAKSGIFLSGGIDSSLIFKLISKKQNLKTFSFFYSKEDGEFKKIKYILEKNNHKGKIFKFSNNNLHKLIKNYSNFFDQPMHDLGNLSLLKLCENMRNRSKLKVVLTGDGADELFGGYDRHLKYKNEKTDKELILGNNILSVLRLKKIKKMKKLNYLTNFRLKKFKEIKKKK